MLQAMAVAMTIMVAVTEVTVADMADTTTLATTIMAAMVRNLVYH